MGAGVFLMLCKRGYITIELLFRCWLRCALCSDWIYQLLTDGEGLKKKKKQRKHRGTYQSATV